MTDGRLFFSFTNARPVDALSCLKNLATKPQRPESQSAQLVHTRDHLDCVWLTQQIHRVQPARRSFNCPLSLAGASSWTKRLTNSLTSR